MPANWKKVNLKNVVQIQVPPTWKVTPGPDPLSTIIGARDKDGHIPGGPTLGLNPYIGGTGDMKADVATLASLDEKLLVHEGDLANIKRLPDVTVNGVELYHLQYQDTQKWFDDFGGVTADGTQKIVVSWVFNRDLIDRKSAEAFEAQVMPTYRLL